MGIKLTTKKPRNLQKISQTFEWGKGPQSKKGAGIFTYVTPQECYSVILQEGSVGIVRERKSTTFA